MKVSEIKPTGRINALFKGETGSGKTMGIGSFPEPIFIADFDGRIKPLATHFSHKDIEFETYEVGNLQAFVDKIQYLYEHRDDSNFPYKTVAIDSYTMMGITLLQHFIKVRGRKGKLVGGFNVNEIEDYMGESAVMQKVLERLKMLPCHVVVTCHVITDKKFDVRTGVTSVSRSMVTGAQKLASIVPGFFDEVWHFDVQLDPETQQPRYTILTQHTSIDFGKTAMKLPGRIDFTNKPLFAEIERLTKIAEIPSL